MKILDKNLKKGRVRVVPRTLDDLWHLYNIIDKGDIVCGRTTREVRVDSEYSRPQKGRRVSTSICIQVEELTWDPTLNRLRVLGRIHAAPEKIAGRGSHHTLKVQIKKPIRIIKVKWLKHQIERLRRASRFESPPIVVLSIDSHEACIAIIREYGVNVKFESRAKLPSKLEAEKRESALQHYFNDALNGLKKELKEGKLSIVVIGVGFIKNQFVKYARSEDPEIVKEIADVKSVNSSGLVGIQEALRSGILEKTLRHLRIGEETMVVEKVLARLGRDERTVSYGSEEVSQAVNFGAVETLLISDLKLRNVSAEERLDLERIMKQAEDKGGKILVVSSEHEAGQKLVAMEGIAALLRFPIN